MRDVNNRTWVFTTSLRSCVWYEATRFHERTWPFVHNPTDHCLEKTLLADRFDASPFRQTAHPHAITPAMSRLKSHFNTHNPIITLRLHIAASLPCDSVPRDLGNISARRDEAPLTVSVGGQCLRDEAPLTVSVGGQCLRDLRDPHFGRGVWGEGIHARLYLHLFTPKSCYSRSMNPESLSLTCNHDLSLSLPGPYRLAPPPTPKASTYTVSIDHGFLWSFFGAS